MTKISRKVGTAAVAFTWSVLLAVPALAAYKILVGVQTDHFQDGGLSGIFLELDNSRRTSLTFNTGTRARTKIYINFKARCSVVGPLSSSSVSVVLYVDGVAVSPGGTDFADVMCREGDLSGNNQQAFTTVGPGTHSVQVRAFLLNDATHWMLDHTTLLVASY